MARGQNQVKIASDRITLFQPDAVKGAIWHCRFTAKGFREYVNQSRDETDLEAA